MDADLYLDYIESRRYWPQRVGVSFDKAMTEISEGKTRLEDYDFLTPQQVKAFRAALNAKDYLPTVPMVTVPQPLNPEVIPLNTPDESSLVVVTGNNLLTIDVITTVWSQSNTPAYLVIVDCLGHTVDMAMIFGEFSPERLKKAFTDGRLEETVNHRHMVVPGLTSPLAQQFGEATGWEIEIGPICAAELPLALGDRWVFP